METTANAQLATVKHAEKVSMEARDTAGQELAGLFPPFSTLQPWRDGGDLDAFFPCGRDLKGKLGSPGLLPTWG